jgi:hypothetical protein
LKPERLIDRSSFGFASAVFKGRQEVRTAGLAGRSLKTQQHATGAPGRGRSVPPLRRLLLVPAKSGRRSSRVGDRTSPTLAAARSSKLDWLATKRESSVSARVPCGTP